MKKTEKIEIRVSPEEKEALSAASRSEGRTASDVLREYVGHYVKAASVKSATPAKEKKMSWISKIAFVALGAAVAVPLTLIAATANKSPDAFKIELLLRQQQGDDINQQSIELGTTLPLGQNGSFVIHAPHEGDYGYRVRADVTKSKGDIYLIAFDICWQTMKTECELVSAPKITTAFADTARLQVAGRDGSDIHIHLRPVTQTK